MEPHLHYKANYYLRLASGAHDSEYMKWYVHSLAVLNDVRTLSVIDICEQKPNAKGEEGELRESSDESNKQALGCAIRNMAVLKRNIMLKERLKG